MIDINRVAKETLLKAGHVRNQLKYMRRLNSDDSEKTFIKNLLKHNFYYSRIYLKKLKDEQKGTP